MLRYCEERQIQRNFGRSQKRCQEIAWDKIPHLLKEREVQGTSSYDKVFAVEWLDDESFVTGTKDNKLLLWNAVTGRRLEISLPVRQGKRAQQVEACGIHSISTNFSKSLLATGANDPNDAAIFSLPSFEPVGILENHDDWIFATAWLTDTVLATGSRDTTVKVWSVDVDGPFTNTQPLVERTEHSGKVRDLKYCAQTQLLATLGQDCTCKIWDPYGMQVVSNVALENKRELVCLALDSRLIAIGSQQHISFIDVRCGHIAKHILSADDGWGVRSLSFKNNLVTCGGGKGRLSFFDLRKEKYILLGEQGEQPAGGKASMYYTKASMYYTSGPGYVEPQSLSNFSSLDQPIRHAIYAHAYDESGTKLLAAGGPLPFGLRGCYIAVW